MYDYLENQSGMVDLTERAGGKLGGFPTLIMDTPGMYILCGFFLQNLHEDNKPEDISNYGNPTLA